MEPGRCRERRTMTSDRSRHGLPESVRGRIRRLHIAEGGILQVRCSGSCRCRAGAARLGARGPGGHCCIRIPRETPSRVGEHSCCSWNRIRFVTGDQPIGQQGTSIRTFPQVWSAPDMRIARIHFTGHRGHQRERPSPWSCASRQHRPCRNRADPGPSTRWRDSGSAHPCVQRTGMLVGRQVFPEGNMMAADGYAPATSSICVQKVSTIAPCEKSHSTN